MNLTDILFENQDETYKIFSEKLTPDTKLPIIGVRVPKLRKIAKDAVSNNDYREFLNEKHKYFEEVFIHGLIIAYSKSDYEKKITLLAEFIPTIDNWAICDSVAASVKFPDEYKVKYFEYLTSLLNDKNTYIVRFAIVSFLDHYVPEFNTEIISRISELKSCEYYVNMALGWLYCEMLIKDYEKILPIIEKRTLPKFVQNVTIKKSCESFRLSKDQKGHLKTLRIK